MRSEAWELECRAKTRAEVAHIPTGPVWGWSWAASCSESWLCELNPNRPRALTRAAPSGERGIFSQHHTHPTPAEISRSVPLGQLRRPHKFKSPFGECTLRTDRYLLQVCCGHLLFRNLPPAASIEERSPPDLQPSLPSWRAAADQKAALAASRTALTLILTLTPHTSHFTPVSPSRSPSPPFSLRRTWTTRCAGCPRLGLSHAYGSDVG